jgi:hypothetical protein
MIGIRTPPSPPLPSPPQATDGTAKGSLYRTRNVAANSTCTATQYSTDACSVSACPVVRTYTAHARPEQSPGAHR